MRVSRLLSGTALVTTLAALMPAAALAGGSTTGGLIQIDESVEGVNPTVSSDLSGANSLGNISVSNPTFSGGLESWTINFTIFNSAISGTGGSIAGAEGGLYEPGTNNTQLSDLLSSNSASIIGGEGAFSFTLVSDGETGGISPAGICGPGVTCLVEDGTFQTLIDITLNTDIGGIPGTVDYFLQLKSDLVEPVPEPGPLAVLTSGLGALWWFRRRRRLA